MTITPIIADANGKEMQDLDIISVTSDWEFNKVSSAEIKLVDGDISKREFPLLEDDRFKIGRQIHIYMREEGNLNSQTEVFSGIITGLDLDISPTEGSTLQINIRHEAFRMTSGRNSEVYLKKKDSEILADLVSNYGLTMEQLETNVKHEQMVKNNATDWDFMVSRAEANGLLIQLSAGKVSCVAPTIQPTPHFTVDLCVKPDVLDFQLQLNGDDQYEQVKARAFDAVKKQMSGPVVGSSELKQNGLDGKKVANDAGIDETILTYAAPASLEELQSWSNAQVMKSLLSLVTGTITLSGKDAQVQVGQTIVINGIGGNSGKNIITGIRNIYDTSQGWVKEIQIGMSADWFASQAKVVDTQASGLLPGVNGMQIGIVKSIQEEHNHIQITVPAFDTEETITARLASIYAGNGYGAFFKPEVNDEVIVGFLNDDPRQAIVLGALHNQVNKTPWKSNSKNTSKGIFVKKGYQLLFDEEAQTITLSTSANNEISIDEKNGSICMKDANSNQLEMNKKGVFINSSGDFQINAKGDLSIKSDKNVSIKGSKINMS